MMKHLNNHTLPLIHYIAHNLHGFDTSRTKNFSIFLKTPLSRIVPKNGKGGTLWDFLNIYSVAK